ETRHPRRPTDRLIHRPRRPRGTSQPEDTRRITMGIAQENFIREFCDAWGDGSDTSRPDVEKILSMMSEDAVWQLWIPGGPIIRGRDALRKEIHQQMQYATNNK